MEQRETIDGGKGKGWTEERHAAFLNWMEESFVHRMLTPNTKEAAAAVGFWPSPQCSPVDPCCDDLPLNRHIPDSATESTGDSRPRHSRLLVESGKRNLVVVTNTNRNRMTKRVLSQLDVPLDQPLGTVVDISYKKQRR